jgi:hypothetical protein
MGVCVYCGKSAGIFRSEHPKCAEQHAIAIAKIPTFFASALTSNVEPARFRELIFEVANTHYLKDRELSALIKEGFAILVSAAVTEGTLSAANEARVQQIRSAFELTISDLGEAGVRFVKAEVLRDLTQGVIKSRMTVQGDLSVIFERDETIVWFFKNAVYQKYNARTGEYDPLGRGDFILTNLNVFFASAERDEKISINKIIAVQEYDGAVHITRASANAKPQVFVVNDPDFAV